MSYSLKTFDEFLTDILTDITNQDNTADVSRGSLLFIKAAALASALWGLQGFGNYISNQILPTTMDEPFLEQYALIRGIIRKPGEKVSQLLARVLDVIQHPPSGGNQHDYAQWAESITGVGKAFTIPLGQGPGTVDVLVLADAAVTGSEIPATDLLAQVRAFIVDQSPNNVKYLRVMGPTIIYQDVSITRVGAELPTDEAVFNITSYMNSMKRAQPLYRAQLSSLALGGLAGDANVLTPAALVQPGATEIIRPGVIDVP